uniref:Uncharacterized protein n=1 Tax=Oryza sativa subsp. japonica TaxID=39947 RepID=Q10MB7_ORYSJ|nr:hypothetical protein LOC_Os03g20060 [Oryza sativa Japonica Group]
MAPRKPTKAGSTGEDPGNLGEGWSCFLGKSLVKEADLGELRSAVSINAKPNMEINGTLESRLILLRKVARRLSTRDLCEEFCLLRISPLARVWDVSVIEGEEVLGLPRLVLPAGVEMRALEDAEIEASKMIRALTTAEFARLLQRQADGRVNHVYTGEFPSQSKPSRAGDDEVGTSKKHKRAVVKGDQVRTRRSVKVAVESDGDEEEEEDVEAGSKDDGSHDIVVANTLLAISSTAAKPVMTARRKKKGKVVQVGNGFSDNEGSDGTPTSPVLRRAASRGRRMSPPPASDAEAATGGSVSAPAAGANVAKDERVDAVPSPVRQREGKAPAVEASVSDVTLTAPHFVPADFATRPEITPFVDGVCQVIAPTEGLGLFTKLNEFSESCAAVESLFVRGLAAHLSAKKSALERLDGYRLRLRKSEEDLRHKEDERRVVAETLKKANAENRSLRSDLEAARKQDAEQDRQLASAKENIKCLEARLVSAKDAAATLVPATESAKEACYTLQLALNDLGARAKGAPGEGGTVLDFSEWTQEAAGSVVEVAGAYGDCCARVSAGFVLSLLHTHGCDHIGNFPDFVKEEWPSNTQCSGAALRAFRKGFWEDGGRDGFGRMAAGTVRRFDSARTLKG